MQIFLNHWIADSFLRHALCALAVKFRDGKSSLGILTLCKFSSAFDTSELFGFETGLLGTISYYFLHKGNKYITN